MITLNAVPKTTPTPDVRNVSPRKNEFTSRAEPKAFMIAMSLRRPDVCERDIPARMTALAAMLMSVMNESRREKRKWVPIGVLLTNELRSSLIVNSISVKHVWEAVVTVKHVMEAKVQYLLRTRSDKRYPRATIF